MIPYTRLGKYGMGQIRYRSEPMSCESETWWMDVLENGRSSPYADFFDIDWNPAIKKLSGKLHIPVLGDQYGKVLESQELKLRFEEGAFFIYYQDIKFPILPETYVLLLQHRTEDLRNLVTNDNPHLTELLSIVTALKHLPPAAEKDAENQRTIPRKEIIKKRLLTLYLESSEIRKFIEDNVDVFNGKKGDPGSFNLLDGLLAEQVWRLSHWRVANEEINYRRFFDINALAAIRIEEPAVFEETHKLIFRLIAEKKITGLRVDHPDGLYDPAHYFAKLQRECFSRLVSTEAPEEDVHHEHSDFGPEVLRRYQSSSHQTRSTNLLCSRRKILTRAENAPRTAIFGTTGYAFKLPERNLR
jgi:(1->4)-alpha-D-glucan 1-alpha-D-glucosylmutase